ncbi:RNA polymerase sigma factor [Lysobacter panacisoli]|nr:sigma-70 family RNA polymerase sigma factor [Lysobacter panacisoli]
MSHAVAATVILPTQLPDDDAPAAGTTGEAGDGFEAFVRDHRGMLVAYLGRRIGEDDAQDIAQETMVRLMRYRAQPVEQLRPLMYRIAINVIHDRGRRDATRQVFAHVSLDQDFVGLASLEPAHDQRIEHEQELALARAAILKLPERCRQVYLLNRIEGMSYSQIAQHCGISVKAVEKHIGKALGILRARLKEGGMDREDRS